MPKLKARTLRDKTKADLEKQLFDFRKELSQLRVAKVTGGSPSQLSQIRVVRKSIGTVLNVITNNQRNNLKQFYAKKKHVPTDLRKKRTRAIRLALGKTLKNKVTLKEQKNRYAFPQRKFTLKA